MMIITRQKVFLIVVQRGKSAVSIVVTHTKIVVDGSMTA
ncbi:hypothetical protein RV15_GL001543 [Enterococcus silesiacus]|uniref:Uncharacterized protein n=1 Tax=Enterococcus silesiacus TaxID=332949 RepID=A0AA91GD04_9ENTE|nr:hypothetical protein RV15_GL001543 [Enterococcus silesiacus]